MSGRTVSALFSAVLVASLACSDASAATPAQKCAAAKRKAVGQTAKALTACDAKAAARGATVDLVCVARAGTAFARVWSRAEKRGGCATTRDRSSLACRGVTRRRRTSAR